MVVYRYLLGDVSNFTVASTLVFPCFTMALLSWSSSLASPTFSVVPLTTVGWYRFRLKLLAALATAKPIAETSKTRRLIIIISLSDKFQLTLYSGLTLWMKQKFSRIQRSEEHTSELQSRENL